MSLNFFRLISSLYQYKKVKELSFAEWIAQRNCRNTH